MTGAELADGRLQAHRRRLEAARVWLAALAALFSAAALAVSVLLLVQLGSVAATNRTNGEVVRDCVEPTGQCYQRNNERTAETVNRLADLMLAVELCGQRYHTDEAARDCVRRALDGGR